MPEIDWDTVWVLFEEASHLAVEDRSAFLDAQCEDPAVREELDSYVAQRRGENETEGLGTE